MLTERSAESSDLEVIVSLTRAQRRQLAEWSPVYFNPRVGSDEAHSGFLGFLVESADHETIVLESEGKSVGFFVRIPQDQHCWIDDLCIGDPALWPAVARAIAAGVADPWVTCVSVHDEARIMAFRNVGARTISTYYARSTSDLEPLPQLSELSVDADISAAARHTFGGRPLMSDVPGGLVVTNAAGGYLVGSPSASPPLYDPGGTTCVIDQVVGKDRSALLGQALGVAAGRGDAQVIVVVAEDDRQLQTVVAELGLSPHVILIGR